jgi:serine/threonine-protein kinase
MTNGARIVGNYALGALLGRGGTSEVYAATDRLVGDEVAVKLIRPQLALDDGLAGAFVAEAARTREIAHPNVVRVLDFGRDEATGSCFLVMERIAGESLAGRLARGAMAEAELRPLAAAIADGMDAAHARGIVHRDLKPGNIMLRAGQPLIIDFGIAKSLDAASAVVTNRRVGTLAYMAPEQLTEGLVTPAADVWALGVVMYEAVTGRLPYDNFTDGRLPQLFDTPPRAGTLVAISVALDALIARCLDRAPAARPTMREVAAALRAPIDERVTEDAGPVLAARVRRRPRWPFAAVGAVAIAGALAYVAWPRPATVAATPAPPSAPAPTAERVTPPERAPDLSSREEATAPAANVAPPPRHATPARTHHHAPARTHHKRTPRTTQGETLD